MTMIASLFDLSGPDLIIILGITLLLFGTKHLPGLGRGTEQAIRGLSRDQGTSEFDRYDLIVPIAILLLLLIAMLINTGL